ncbi:MAG: hypothetical protein ACRCSG_05550 [Cellulosilyticaceae bacterium]
MTMRSVGQHIIITIERLYEKSVKHGSLELSIDPMFNPTNNLVYKGIVSGISDAEPFDEYGNKINSVIQNGDLAYFRYTSTDDPRNRIGKEISDFKEMTQIRVFYKDVFCVVRNGGIIPVGGWILGEPFIDGEGELIELELESGKKGKVRVEYYENSSIIKNTNNTLSKHKAIIKHIGVFKDQETELKVNDVVFSKHVIAFVNNIEGVDYYCFQEDIIDAIL